MDQLKADELLREMRKLCSWKLRTLTNTDYVDDVVNVILSIERDEDVRKYITDYINNSSISKKTNAFINEFLGMKRRYKDLIERSNSQKRVLQPLPLDSGVQVYKKGGIVEVGAGISKKKNQRAQKMQNKKTRQILDQQTSSEPFVRVQCDCQATIHPLIGNCLRCGKIICASEGEGPCMFCGELASRDAEFAEGSAEAVLHRDKLLNYERQGLKLKNVYDDQEDHFDYESNPWLSKKEKEQHRKRAEERERQQIQEKNRISITLDLAGRQIISTQDYSTNAEVEGGKSISFANPASSAETQNNNESDQEEEYKEDKSFFPALAPPDRPYQNPFLSGSAPVFRKPTDQKKKPSYSTILIQPNRKSKENNTVRCD